MSFDDDLVLTEAEPQHDVSDQLLDTASMLQTLRMQSLILRERTLHIRSAAMEARALARDLRLRRAAYADRVGD